MTNDRAFSSVERQTRLTLHWRDNHNSKICRGLLFAAANQLRKPSYTSETKDGLQPLQRNVVTNIVEGARRSNKATE